MMGARLTAALLAGRAAAALSRRLGRGGGTVIAGHIVPRLDPRALRQIAARLPLGCVLISGTNGKTTTARMLAHILAGAGLTSLHNRAGANLLSGLVASVVEQTTLAGTPRADIGVFEVDEATLPAALEALSARAIVLTNIFRDQLDRYGEVAYVAALWRQAVQRLPQEVELVLNADDPQVAALGLERQATTFFGIADRAHGQASLPHAADVRLCPSCGAELAYEWAYYGHLGHYRCPACAFARPSPHLAAIACSPQGDKGSAVRVRTPTADLRLQLPLPGLYNVYNALAASACALRLGVEPAVVVRQLESFHAAFGRLERILVEERQLFLALVKNPVGCTEVLKTVLADGEPKNVAIMINDLFADGTDVSWLWDADFELLAGRVRFVIASGLRAGDMAVRLKYALVAPERIVVEPDPRLALEAALQRTEPGETIYLLPTYTAMLEVRELLQRQGYVSGFWED
ncbi:MAG: Mur ligase family protein [Chloroflexi bacterium]|nr:Mur ligase family protein [Chloroflexota bacterium]